MGLISKEKRLGLPRKVVKFYCLYTNAYTYDLKKMFSWIKPYVHKTKTKVEIE